MSRSSILRSPLAILFNPTLLKRVKPWDVRLSSLLLDILSMLEEENDLDLRLLGTALFSSSYIYRMKVEVLLSLDRPRPVVSMERRERWVFPAMSIPYRSGVPSTTVDNLLEALRTVLEEAGRIRPIQDLDTVPPADEWLGIKKFLAQVKADASSLYKRLKGIGKAISFMDFFRGLTRWEVIRNFLLILFLANDGRIVLSQKEDGGDIFIEVRTPAQG